MHTHGFNEKSLLRHMPAIQAQKHELRMVEAAWENLSLLSSLSALTANQSTGRELDRFKQEFSSLAKDMVAGLMQEDYRQLSDTLCGKAQFCIDILVRNLFERTADIGFLASDEPFINHLRQPQQADPMAIEQRMATYRSYYSVYQGVYLFDADSQLISSSTAAGVPTVTNAAAVSQDDRRWLQAVASSDAPYIEFHGSRDFLHSSASGLLYAKRVCDDTQVLGVLCLSFRLNDEVDAIFAALREESDPIVVLAILDSSGRVIGSSDTLQLPIGHQLLDKAAGQTAAGTLRHMGRSYLAFEVTPNPFEGYSGPCWTGLAMVALDVAFGEVQREDATEGLLDEIVQHNAFLKGNLQSIPGRSRAIQSALDRSVWNGLLDIARAQKTDDTPIALSDNDLLFARTLLSEISSTARKTAGAFTAAVGQLHRVVAESMVSDAMHRAGLAMQILDRNLYERANDCRWWAHSPSLREAIEHPDGSAVERARHVLRYINSLYTVYHGIVIYDAQGRVVATSRDDWQTHVGTSLPEGWVRDSLSLLQANAYCVSPWQTDTLSPDEPTFVYAAAIRDEQDQVIGGLGVVWKAREQMEAMLKDCAALEAERDALCFTTAQVPLIVHGSAMEAADLFQARCIAEQAPSHQTLVTIGGSLYAAGWSAGIGYREYRHDDGYQHGVQVLVLRHLCVRQTGGQDNDWIQRLQRPPLGSEQRLTVGTFLAGGQWLGLPAQHIRFAAAYDGHIPVGKGPAHFCGMVQIDYQVYPVICAATLIGAKPAGGSHRQVLIIEVVGHKGSTARIALLVDNLGPILELDSASLQPAFSSQSGLVSHVVGIALQHQADAAIAEPSTRAGNPPHEKLLALLHPGSFAMSDQP